MSNKFAATLPAGHSLGLAAGSHRSSRKSPKSARKTHEPLKELYDEKSVVLTQAALRRRLAVEERSRLGERPLSASALPLRAWIGCLDQPTGAIPCRLQRLFLSQRCLGISHLFCSPTPQLSRFTLAPSSWL